MCGAAGATCSNCPSGDTCDTSNGTCVSSGPCTWTAGPNSSNGEITCYWFGQGTAKGGGCSSYKTYCGYCGTETGTNNGGTCPTGITDSVPNTGTQYFAAFPVGTFGQGKYCGMCVDVTWMGKTITATIVDECATCTTAGHIDLSLSAAVALGLGQGTTTGDAKTGVTWKAVDCPITGNIVAVFNGTNTNSQQIYFQNVVFPVAAATAGTHVATQAFGYWDFGAAVAGQTVTLTDTVGHVVMGTIPSTSGGSVGVQFPETCQ
jgi:expansin (peptidoglycan-binding protein)